MTTLDDLIARLETATGPDRELDARIYCRVYEGFAIVEGDVLAVCGGFVARLSPDDLPRYTASIDAALTLVPEGLGWMVRNVPVDNAEVYDQRGRIAADAPQCTPALALCIAALKARKTEAAA